MGQLFNRQVVLGITGGIAAYKAAHLARELRESGARVRVAMTRGAAEFITPLTMQALSGEPVHHDLLDASAEAGMGHIELARWAELVIVAPATADFLSRLAHGRADDLLAALCLATGAKRLLAPAMNQAMWRNPATAANIARLRERGFLFIGPAEGAQACGDEGPGRMEEPPAIAAAAAALYGHGALDGMRVAITAGPTREALDPVRYISNHSSGKMGFALARAAADAGAMVTLIAGPVGTGAANTIAPSVRPRPTSTHTIAATTAAETAPSTQPRDPRPRPAAPGAADTTAAGASALSVPESVRRIDVISAEEMLAASMQALDESGCDIFIGCAAVADYRPANLAPGKIKKDAATMTVELTRTPDIIATVAARGSSKAGGEDGSSAAGGEGEGGSDGGPRRSHAPHKAPRPFTVGFAAETADVKRNAAAKLKRKGLDMIIANDVSAPGAGFNSENNAVIILWKGGSRAIPLTGKPQLAAQLIDLIAARYRETTG